MFLGTHRGWWLAAAILILLGLIATGTGIGGWAGLVLVVAGLLAFTIAPRKSSQPPPPPPPPAAAPPQPRPPRPKIDAGDPSEV